MVQEGRERREPRRVLGGPCERVARWVGGSTEGSGPECVLGSAERVSREGGVAGQQGQILLWAYGPGRIRTEMCPLDDISRKQSVISGRAGSVEGKLEGCVCVCVCVCEMEASLFRCQ